MRRLSDTGRQIDESMQRRFGRTHSELDRVRRESEVESEQAAREQPAHPVAALGATFFIVGALVVALVGTALFAVSVFVAVPLLLGAIAVLGAWGFVSWGRKRRARRESSTVPGDALAGE